MHPKRPLVPMPVLTYPLTVETGMLAVCDENYNEILGMIDDEIADFMAEGVFE